MIDVVVQRVSVGGGGSEVAGAPGTWIDAAAQINEDYEKNVPMFVVPNVLNFATEGKDFRYGTVCMPVE